MKGAKRDAAQKLCIVFMVVLLVTVSFAFAKKNEPREDYNWDVYIPIGDSLGLQPVGHIGEFPASDPATRNFANVTMQKGNYWSVFNFEVAWNGGVTLPVILEGIETAEDSITCEQGEYCTEMFEQIGREQPNGEDFDYPSGEEWPEGYEAHSERIYFDFVSYAPFNYSEQEIGDDGQKRLAKVNFSIDSEPCCQKVANFNGQILGELTGEFFLTRVSEDEWHIEGDSYRISAHQYQVVDVDEVCWGKKCQDRYVYGIVADGYAPFETHIDLRFVRGLQ